MTGALDGVWRLDTYVVGGQEQQVHGLLFLTGGYWSTLYFVPGDGGAWGSAEAGRYQFDGRQLVFLHQLVFQGGGGRPLRMDERADREETCQVTLEGGRLSIDFPSGNTLHLRRTGG